MDDENKATGVTTITSVLKQFQQGLQNVVKVKNHRTRADLPGFPHPGVLTPRSPPRLDVVAKIKANTRYRRWSASNHFYFNTGYDVRLFKTADHLRLDRTHPVSREDRSPISGAQ